MFFVCAYIVLQEYHFVIRVVKSSCWAIYFCSIQIICETVCMKEPSFAA